MNTPRFTHDCPECHYLGEFHERSGYYCTRNRSLVALGAPYCAEDTVDLEAVCVEYADAARGPWRQLKAAAISKGFIDADSV